MSFIPSPPAKPTTDDDDQASTTSTALVVTNSKTVASTTSAASQAPSSAASAAGSRGATPASRSVQSTALSSVQQPPSSSVVSQQQKPAATTSTPPQQEQQMRKASVRDLVDDSSDEDPQDEHISPMAATLRKHVDVILSAFTPAVLCWRADFTEVSRDLLARMYEQRAQAAISNANMILESKKQVGRQQKHQNLLTDGSAEKARNVRENSLCVNMEMFYHALEHKSKTHLPLAVTERGSRFDSAFFGQQQQQQQQQQSNDDQQPNQDMTQSQLPQEPEIKLNPAAMTRGRTASENIESNPHILETAGALFAFSEHISSVFDPPYDSLCRRAIRELQTVIYWDHRTVDDRVTLHDIMQQQQKHQDKNRQHSSSHQHQQQQREAELLASRYVHLTWCQLYTFLLDRARHAKTMVNFKQNTLSGQLALLDRTVDQWRRATSLRLLREWYDYTMRQKHLRRRYRETFVSLSTTATSRRAITRWRHVCRMVRDRMENGDASEESVEEVTEDEIIPASEGGDGTATRKVTRRVKVVKLTRPPISADGMALATVRALQGQVAVRTSMLDHLSNVVKQLQTKSVAYYESVDHVLQRQDRVLSHFRNVKNALYPELSHARCMPTEDWVDVLKHDLEERHGDFLELLKQQQQQETAKSSGLGGIAGSFRGLGPRMMSGLPRTDSFGASLSQQASMNPTGSSNVNNNNNNNNANGIMMMSTDDSQDPLSAEGSSLEWHKVLATVPRTSTRVSHILVRVRHLLSVLCVVVSALQRDLSTIVNPPVLNSASPSAQQQQQQQQQQQDQQQQQAEFDPSSSTAAIDLNGSFVAGNASFRADRVVSFKQARKAFDAAGAGYSSQGAQGGGGDANDARSVIVAFMSELDLDNNEKVVDEITFVRALLAAVNRVAFAGLFTPVKQLNEDNATLEVDVSKPSTLQAHVMNNLFLTPAQWGRAIEFDNSNTLSLLKSSLHSLFALCPIPIPKLLLLMDTSSSSSSSNNANNNNNSGNNNAASSGGMTRSRSIRLAPSSLGDKRDSNKNAASEKALKNFRKKALIAATAVKKQHDQQRRESGQSRMMRGIPAPPMPSVADLKREWDDSVRNTRENQWTYETCQRGFEERARQIVADAFERGQSSQLVASVFDKLVRAAPKLRYSIPIDFLASKLRMVFSEELEQLTDNAGALDDGSAAAASSSSSQHQHQQQQQSSPSSPSSIRKLRAAAARVGQTAVSSPIVNALVESSSMLSPNSSLASPTSSPLLQRHRHRSFMSVAVPGAWRQVLQGRKHVEDAKELEFVLHSVSKIMMSDITHICEKLVDSLDDVDLMFVALSSHELHTVLLENANELAGLFLVHATRRRGGAGGAPPPPPQSPATKNQQISSTDNNNNNNKNSPTQDQQQQQSPQTRTPTTTVQQHNATPLLMSRDDFAEFAKPWCDAFLTPPALHEIFVTTIHRYDEDARSVTSQSQTQQLLMSQELFPYAIALVAATKYASPMVPLKVKVQLFLQQHVIPMANSMTRKREDEM